MAWLAAALVAAICNLVAVSVDATITQNDQAALVIILAGTLAAAGLMAARSTTQQILSDRDERARPTADELAVLADPAPAAYRVHGHGHAYVLGMQRWTTALLELLDHASAEATNPDRAQELADAAEDTRAMHDLLLSKDPDQLSLRESAMLHAIATLWETGQERLELIAADVDKQWYRRWHARTVIERNLRHGAPRPPALVLPYG